MLLGRWEFIGAVLCPRVCSPSNPSLLGLNVNRGEEIRIRLRFPHNERVFFPYEHLVGTMLHELTHIVHGPHDAKFYSLLGELEKVSIDSTESSKGKGFWSWCL